MRWSIVRIIWLREMRDQLRDRRTLFMMAGLPLLLYPFLGMTVIRFALDFAERKIAVGIVQSPDKSHDFPARGGWEPVLSSLACLSAGPAMPGASGVEQLTSAASLANASRSLRGPGAGLSPLPCVAWISAALPVPGSDGLASLTRTTALAEYARISADYPLLIQGDRFEPLYLQTFPGAPAGSFQTKIHIQWYAAADRAPLDEKKVDVLLSADPDFWAGIDHGQPRVLLEYRDNDEGSRYAFQRVQFLVLRWKKHIKEIRLVRHGLPSRFDDPFELLVPDSDRGGGIRNMVEMLIKIFPFMLVMWSLAGALYPAVDLCAGEKERGTMETLLISPAGREEIVWGKFLTIWCFSTVTALLNVLSMGLTTWVFADRIPHVGLTFGGLLWSVLLLLPLAAFFSAVCLSIGAYARSSKEGQYYLMPLFLITFPLIFLTLAPGVELNSFYCMVPVTGVALLMQKLMTTGLPGHTWFYFVSVMAPIALYSWLALRWAIDQFQREEVLFREAERIDVRLWLRRLFREKDTRPTTGQALFCFVLLLALRALSESLGREIPLLARTGIVTAAFVVAPPVIMALVLTTRPRQVLAAWWPAWPYLAASALLIPLIQFAFSQAHYFPRLPELLLERQNLVAAALNSRTEPYWPVSVLALAILSAAGKEIAFRGFIFAGLLRRMRPWPAILVSSFLFAAFHLNVFLLPPLFLLGIALGILALRSGSLLPGIILHAVGLYLLLLGDQIDYFGLSSTGLGVVAAISASLAACLLWWQNRRAGSGLVQALFAMPRPADSTKSTVDASTRTPAPAATKSLQADHSEGS